MKTTTANSYRITQFKKELWIDMSNACDSRFWSYSASEKRLFLILVALLISLSLFYFNSYRNQDKVVRAKVEQYASSNADTLKRLQIATVKEVSPTPLQTDNSKQNSRKKSNNVPVQNYTVGESKSSIENTEETRDVVPTVSPTPTPTKLIDALQKTPIPTPSLGELLDQLKLKDVNDLIPNERSSQHGAQLGDLEEVVSFVDTLVDQKTGDTPVQNLIQLP